MLDEVNVQKFSKCPPEVASRLLGAGILKSELEALVRESLGDLSHLGEAACASRIETARMNLIGGLRNVGYIVEGGRQNRSLPYRIVGFEAPKEKRPISVWGGKIWDEIQQCPRILNTYAWRNRLRTLLWQFSDSKRDFHERSLHYLFCYEMANDRAYFYESNSGGMAIILQKHRELPRFRIYNLNMGMQSLMSLAEYIAPISMAKIRILPLDEAEARELRTLDSRVVNTKRVSAIYDWENLRERQREILGNRGMTSLRKAYREIDWKPLTLDLGPSAKEVIDVWKKLNVDKHRQLAITRDYRSLEIALANLHCREQYEHAFVGLREGHPVCLHIADGIGLGNDFTALIVEKSLNYSSFSDGSEVPGGKYGTADFNTFALGDYMLSQGIRYMNAGTYEGGGHGLPQHKQRFASIDQFSYVSEMPYETVTKAQLYE